VNSSSGTVGKEDQRTGRKSREQKEEKGVSDGDGRVAPIASSFSPCLLCQP
jgi:hypothetical protein